MHKKMLQEHVHTLPVVEEPYISPQQALQQITHQQELVEQQWRSHWHQVSDLLAEKDRVEKQQAALCNLVRAHGPEEQAQEPPKKRRKHQPISDEVKAMVERNVFKERRMMYEEAAQAYGILESLIRQIVQAAQEEEAAAAHTEETRSIPWPTKKRRGPKPRLNGEDVLFLLDWLEENPLLMLKDLAQHADTQLSKCVSKSTID